MPETTPETKSSFKNATFRGACLTIFNCTDFDQLPAKLSYFAYGHETCPTTGRSHLQAFAYATTPIRFTAWKKLFPSAHIEAMRGNFTQNEKYCSKQNSLIEFGERPMENGHRRSDLIVKELIDSDPNKSLMEIYDETCERSALVYSKAFEQYREFKRSKTIKADFSAPEVIFIYGPPGTGKTRFVRESEPDVYDVPDGWQWFNGYCGQDAILFDNLEVPIQNKSFFLKLIDRYPIQVPIKGGFTWWKPKRIYITSIHCPDSVAASFSNVQEFFRRVTVFKELRLEHDYSHGGKT